ncbi:MAG: hypothetical protein H0U04_07465 [Rubrobacter sp.]|nr:hypothetical protein [Rubrobacter sp.]
MSGNQTTLACDVDSTVWDTGVRVREAVFEVTGEMLDVETVTTWTHVLETYGEQITTEIFDRALSPERVAGREPYPHAPEVIRRLQDERGIRVHFVTHYWNPDAMTPYLKPWLKENFGENVGLTVTIGDKLSILRDLGAFGMIDDRPDTLERVAGAGLWAATVIQPWNRKVVAENPKVHGFSDWREVLELLSHLPPAR